MTSRTGLSRYSVYGDLVNKQINRTASYAESQSPPRALSAEEVLTTIAPNFEYYIGILTQRALRFYETPDILTVEAKRANYSLLLVDILHSVNSQFVGPLHIECELAPVIDLFPSIPQHEQGFAAAG